MGSGFRQAMRLMRRCDPQLAEDGFQRLRLVANQHVAELIEVFGVERDHGLRCWLLELIGEARSDRAFELLAAELRSDDESLRGWAVRGLELLDTAEARRLLWRWRENQGAVEAPVDEP
ncbi:HEAT repeat domain-containing protein [Micromonospora sp. IBHARD004]|uniref:HEAT repeat domain-containing protein n=1 Tax=Micromonospora sp. IBHARD004 TaxID=3457764 RepID=UPI00405991D5